MEDRKKATIHEARKPMSVYKIESANVKAMHEHELR
jgi:hypothetical protein